MRSISAGLLIHLLSTSMNNIRYWHIYIQYFPPLCSN
jgi:hypothetical protein